MTKIVWLTDIHLNFVEEKPRQAFLSDVRNAKPDVVLIGGDIGEAHSVTGYLKLLDDCWGLPIYFVLGNHDFYFGAIRSVRETVTRLCQHRANLHFLTSAKSPVQLAGHVGLIGHDGWADGRSGNYEQSSILLNDYRLIEELSECSKQTRRQRLESLGDEAADHTRSLLTMALEQHSSVYLLTHVPPVREACWYEDRVSDDNWAPHFTCVAMGQAMLEVMTSEDAEEGTRAFLEKRKPVWK